MSALDRWNEITREHNAWKLANPVPVVETPVTDAMDRLKVVLADLAGFGVSPDTTVGDLHNLLKMMG